MTHCRCPSAPTATCSLGETDLFRPMARLGDHSFEFVGDARDLAKGEDLYRDGDEGDRVFICLKGLLKSRKEDRLGREVITRIIEPGMWFGSEAIAGIPFGATVRAMQASRVCGVPVARLQDLMRERPSLIESLVTSIARETVRLEECLRDFGLKDARARVASVLLARIRNGTADEGGELVVTPRLTRQDLAAMTGMTPETFIRVLSSLRSRGIVHSKGQRIVVLDPHRLASIAGQRQALHPAEWPAQAPVTL